MKIDSGILRNFKFDVLQKSELRLFQRKDQKNSNEQYF